MPEDLKLVTRLAAPIGDALLAGAPAWGPIRGRVQRQLARRAHRRQAIEAWLLPTVLGQPTAHCTKEDALLDVDGDPIWVRRVIPRAPRRGHVALFIHGNTFPSIADFDLPAEEGSLVERLAERGVESWIFDHRGYGMSPRPRAGRRALESRRRDLEVLLEHVLAHCGVDGLCFVALSSAALPVAALLAGAPRGVAASALLGPTYRVNEYLLGVLRKLQLVHLLRCVAGDPENDMLSITRAGLLERLHEGEEERMPRERVERFIDAAMYVTEPGSASLRSPVVGFLEPARRYAIGDHLFDATVLRGPVLLLRGERDELCDDASASELTGDAVHAAIEEHVVPGVKHDFGLYPGGDADAFEVLCRFLGSARAPEDRGAVVTERGLPRGRVGVR